LASPEIRLCTNADMTENLAYYPATATQKPAVPTRTASNASSSASPSTDQPALEILSRKRSKIVTVLSLFSRRARHGINTGVSLSVENAISPRGGTIT
jgi:hypothetical protein